MTTIQQDIPPTSDDRYYAGETAIIEVDVTSPLTAAQFNSANITFTLSQYHGAEPLIKKTESSPHVSVTDIDKQILKLKVTPADTDSLGGRDGRDYAYEIAIEAPSGENAHVTAGTWTIYDASVPNR
jgi:hypothetical protein